MGVTLFENYIISTTSPIQLSIALVVLLIGVIITISAYKTQWDCKVCNHKKALIKLDTPEALEIIKKYDLQVPKEDVKIFPWQT